MNSSRFCPDCGADLAHYYTALNEPDPESQATREEQSPKEKRLRILADFELRDCVVVRYLGKGGKVVIPDGVTAIGDGAFYRSGVIKEVVCPESLKEIGREAFYYCSELERISLSSDLERIEDKAFQGSSIIGSLLLPPNLKSIGRSAFEDCGRLNEIAIPASVQSIGQSAFISCERLVNIHVDKKNKTFSSVDGVLFDKERKILLCYPAGRTEKSYGIPSSVKKVASSAFYENNALEAIHIPAGVTGIQSNAFLCAKNLKKIKVSAGNKYYCDVKGVLYNKEKTVLAALPAALEESLFRIPDGVVEIGENAVVDYRRLVEATIPSSVRKIGSNSFYGCNNLERILVDDRNPCFAEIDGVLYNKERTVLLRYPANRTKNYLEIPEGVKRIEKAAFAYSHSLSGVILPTTMEMIGEFAFFHCDNLGYAYVPNGFKEACENTFPSNCVVTEK